MSARKGTDICELHTMGLYTKASVISKMHTCEYLHVHKEVLTVSACKGIDICEFPHRGFLFKSVHQMKYLICIYIYIFINIFTSGYLHVYKEVRSVSTREGTDICEFAHDGFVYKSFYDLKNVYL